MCVAATKMMKETLVFESAAAASDDVPLDYLQIPLDYLQTQA
jgi:hypothetical protein